MQNLRAILEEAGSGLDRLVKTTVFLQNLDDFAGDERGLRGPRRRPPARPLHGGGGEAPLGRARRDRSDGAVLRNVAGMPRRPGFARRSPDEVTTACGLGRRLRALARARRLPRRRRRPRRAARDRRRRSSTSSSPGSATPSCGPRSSRTAGRGPRSSPTSASVCGCFRATRRYGRSSRPGSSSRRRASSARPGPAATTSRSSPTPASRSSRTWSAATSRSTRSPGDSRPGRSSIRSAAAPTSSRASCGRRARRASATTRCGSCAACASSRSSGSIPTRTRSGRCASGRRRSSNVSGERIGGGLAADGMGELSKLLLGAHPAKALRLARDTGVLVAPAARVRAGDRL